MANHQTNIRLTKKVQRHEWVTSHRTDIRESEKNENVSQTTLSGLRRTTAFKSRSRTAQLERPSLSPPSIQPPIAKPLMPTSPPQSHQQLERSSQLETCDLGRSRDPFRSRRGYTRRPAS